MHCLPSTLSFGAVWICEECTVKYVVNQHNSSWYSVRCVKFIIIFSIAVTFHCCLIPSAADQILPPYPTTYNKHKIWFDILFQPKSDASWIMFTISSFAFSIYDSFSLLALAIEYQSLFTLLLMPGKQSKFPFCFSYCRSSSSIFFINIYDISWAQETFIIIIIVFCWNALSTGKIARDKYWYWNIVGWCCMQPHYKAIFLLLLFI